MRSSVHFLLNGAPVSVSELDPHTTVLQFLRDQRGLVGTKEGCAEGDCGACTVVIAELGESGRVEVKPINACIRLLPTIDGNALFTVEALSNANTNAPLHPVQAAMVEAHASQCGFCTPGFVMSLFALFKNEVAPSRERVCEAIAGNLCRCTGYRPIVDAGMQATAACFAQQNWAKHEINSNLENSDKSTTRPTKTADIKERWTTTWLHLQGRSDAVSSSEQALIDAIRALPSNASNEALHYNANGHRFFAPRTVEDFTSLVSANPNAWVLAGGTDVGLWITKALQTNATIIYSGEVAALRRIDETETALEIGAAASLDDAFHAMNRLYPELAHVWTRFASWPIRSSGTLGGNVANGSPIGDSMPALIALDAKVVLRKGNLQRTIPLEALYIDYKKQSREAGEWIEKIVVAKRTQGLQLGFYKNSKRNEQDISAVCAAIALTLDRGVVQSARLGYGGMAGIPKRATNAENALVGKAWSETNVRSAMQAMQRDFTPMSDMRASAEYRMQIARNLLLRFWFESQGEVVEAKVF
jgi:xanthine dehydrogenase small subunit